MEKHAILKMINQKDSSIVRAEHSGKYIQSFARTDKKCVRAQYLSPSNIKHDLAIIEARYRPKGTRSYKHGVLSFGASVEELPPERALQFTVEWLQFYEGYPWIAAVHVNKPRHIHSHFLLGTTNIRTGKKMTQSPKDLKMSKAYYNQVAQKYNLPLVLYDGMDTSTPSEDASTSQPEANTFSDVPKNTQAGDTMVESNRGYQSFYDCSPTDMILPEIVYEPLFPEPSTSRIQQSDYGVIPLLMNVYQENVDRFFHLGYGRSGKLL